MDLYDFVLKQNETFENHPSSNQITNNDFVETLFEYAEAQQDSDDLLKITFGSEVPELIARTWVNIAFMALQAAHFNGADKEMFDDVMFSILATGKGLS
jgi:hypothetical protein